MIGKGNTRYKARIVEAVLLIRKICILPEVALAHAKTLEKCNAKYLIRRVERQEFLHSERKSGRLARKRVSRTSSSPPGFGNCG